MMSYGDALSRGTLLHGSALSYGFLFGRGGVCTLGELLFFFFWAQLGEGRSRFFLRDVVRQFRTDCADRFLNPR